MKAKHKAQGIVTLRDGSKKPIYRRGCSPASLANLQPQRRGQPSHGPNGRRGNRSLQSELDKIIDPDGMWDKWKRDNERMARLLLRSFREQTGKDLNQLCEKAYGWRLTPAQKRTAA